MFKKLKRIIQYLGGDEFVLNSDGSGSIHYLENYGETGNTILSWDNIEQLEKIFEEYSGYLLDF